MQRDQRDDRSSATPSTITSVLSRVGELLYRVSMVAENFEAGRRRAGKIGEHADDLRAEVVAAAFAAQRLARVRRQSGPVTRPTNSPVTLSACAVNVSSLAGRAEHLRSAAR